MSQETQDLVSWPRDLCGKLHLACEGTDSPTGVYPPLDRADLPRWVWCVLTWTLAAATLLGVFYSDFASLTFFVGSYALVAWRHWRSSNRAILSLISLMNEVSILP